MEAGRLAGRRVLVVEDETVIAMMIEAVLADLGCEAIGPVSRLDAALDLAGREAIDAAILDVTVRGGRIFPVAETLAARGIPFVLASGYGDGALPPSLAAIPRLTKPYSIAELERAILGLLPI